VKLVVAFRATRERDVRFAYITDVTGAVRATIAALGPTSNKHVFLGQTAARPDVSS